MSYRGSEMEGGRLLDREWERIQTKTFTKWVSSKLSLRSQEKPIENLAEDLHDGTRLIVLMEVIGNENLGKYVKNPKLRIQKIENLNRVLDYVKYRGVRLVNIGSEELCDKNEKLFLGLIWTIILRFTIADISEEGLSSKEGLLLWCQRKTKGYRDVDVQDFTYSWKDGLAFCALIHKHRPDLLDYDSLSKDNKVDNLNLAFDRAEKELGIHRILDAEDLVNIEKPDERSVMTYVASYFHAFSDLDRAETAGRRVGKFAAVGKSAWEMQNDYEKRARQLTNDIKQQMAYWVDQTFDSTYRDARQKRQEFANYKSTTRRTWIAEKQDLYALLSNLQTKLITYNMRPYNPPEGLHPKDLENVLWKELIRNENARKKLIAEKVRAARETLRQEFAESANAFHRSLGQLEQSFSNVGGDLELQLRDIETIMKNVDLLAPRLNILEEIHSRCEEASIEDNEFTSYTYDDLQYEFRLLQNILLKKRQFIENQIIARKQSNVTPQQLEEFETTFHHFDKDHDNMLGRDEFENCLASLGKAYQDSEMDRLFRRLAVQEKVNFEKFLEFMISITTDRATSTQIGESFRALANGKPFITEEDMHVGQLRPDEIEYLLSVMPPTSDGQGYDFESYLYSIFG